MTSKEAWLQGLKQVTQSLRWDVHVETRDGSNVAYVWCVDEAARLRTPQHRALVVQDYEEGVTTYSVWAGPVRSAAPEPVLQDHVEDQEVVPVRVAPARVKNRAVVRARESQARVDKAFWEGVAKATRHSHQDYYQEGLSALFWTKPSQPCCCIRCHAVVSAAAIDQHFVVHEQTIDSMGAPGSTRWCPQHVKVHGVFGMTGLKANGRKHR